MSLFSNTSSVRAQTSTSNTPTDQRSSHYIANSTNSTNHTANSEYHSSNATAMTNYSRIDVEAEDYAFTYDVNVPANQIYPMSRHYYLQYSSQQHQPAEYPEMFEVDKEYVENVANEPDIPCQYQQLQPEPSSQQNLHQEHTTDIFYTQDWARNTSENTTTDSNINRFQKQLISPPHTPAKYKTKSRHTQTIGLQFTPPQTPRSLTSSVQTQKWLIAPAREEVLRVGLSLSARRNHPRSFHATPSSASCVETFSPSI